MGIRKLFAAVSETASASTASSLFLPGLLVEPAPTLSRWDSRPSWLSPKIRPQVVALDSWISQPVPDSRRQGRDRCWHSDNLPLTTRRNYFYGNKFNHPTLVCRGGQVHCGTNNSVVDNKITIEMGADESALSPARVALVMRKKGIHRLVNCDQCWRVDSVDFRQPGANHPRFLPGHKFSSRGSAILANCSHLCTHNDTKRIFISKRDLNESARKNRRIPRSGVLLGIDAELLYS